MSYCEGNSYGQGNSFGPGSGERDPWEPPLWRRQGPMPAVSLGDRP